MSGAGSSQPADTREHFRIGVSARQKELEAAGATSSQAYVVALVERLHDEWTENQRLWDQADEIAELREALEAARAFVAGVDISFGLMAEPADQWRYALLPKIDSALSRGATS